MKCFPVRICFYALICLFLFYTPGLTVLKIEQEHQVRWFYFTNPDFIRQTSDEQNYFTQRVGLIVQGNIIKQVELSLGLQVFNLWGNIYKLSNSPYPDVILIPWLNRAYLKLNNVLDFRGVLGDLIVGRQKLTLDSGLIIDDNSAGRNSLRLNVRYGNRISGVIFIGKTDNWVNPNLSVDQWGIGTNYQTPYGTINLHYYNETDRNFGSPAITKDYLGIHASRKTEEGIFYEIETNLHGSNYFSTPNLYDLSLLLLVGIRFNIPRVNYYGSFVTGFVRGAGTPELVPRNGRKWDGPEQVGFGDYFTANFTDARIPLPVNYQLRGIQTSYVQLNLKLQKNLSLVTSFYGFVAVNPLATEKRLGEEIALSCKYDPWLFTSLDLTLTRFYPSDVILYGGSYGEKICLTLTGKF